MPEAELVEKWKARIPRAKDAKPFSDLKEEWNDFEEKAELLIRYGVKACSFTFAAGRNGGKAEEKRLFPFRHGDNAGGSEGF